VENDNDSRSRCEWSEYLDTFGLVKSYFSKFLRKCSKKKIEKKSGKKMSWCSDAPEDEAISLFAGLLANPDMTLSLTEFITNRVPYRPIVLLQSTEYTYLTLGSWKCDIGFLPLK
jgi:hypothetical protein